MGTEETISCPSVSAGGGTGAAAADAGALLAALAACAEAARACCLASAFWQLKGAAVFDAGLPCCVVALSSGSSVGRCWKIIANPTIRQSPPATPPTSFQWFPDLAGVRETVCAAEAGMRVVPGAGVFNTWLAEGEGIALIDWLAEGEGIALID